MKPGEAISCINSSSVQADFFQPRITLYFMHIGYAFDYGFLNPFVHLILVLIEPITAKDIATSKRWLYYILIEHTSCFVNQHHPKRLNNLLTTQIKRSLTHGQFKTGKAGEQSRSEAIKQPYTR